ncbi:MAG: TRAP transporter permease [Rhizobiales bacterium]|nr:TRAP transporter permease [Hyphomicrobiales bacterium]NRB15887.1 TRAP transporter permease [Hyphomicrobiales bacterium]
MDDQTKNISINVDDIATSADVGGRKSSGTTQKIILGTALVWSLFQIWISSPLPYIVGFDWLLFNGNQTRSIHLAFAIFLVFLSFPRSTKSPQNYVPIIDWVAATVAALCAAYYFLDYESISERVGAPNTRDIIIACIGIPLLLEAARRSLGSALVVIAVLFLLYSFFGNYMPELIEHKGYSLSQVVNHQWVTTEGVFGVALGVATDFVFLFVLFGTLLEKAGAGNYFIQLAFSLLGHFKGGPAKAAVVASGLTGIISGSSIANVVTTGTFTMPMMKRVGFSAEKAGAIEVASSVNGQIMPPVMGAAAFLMVEYVGVSYLEVITHAFLPALISYIALVYIVHLEALKYNMNGLPRHPNTQSFIRKVSGFLFGFLGFAGLAMAVYYGIGWIKPLAKDDSGWIIAGLITIIYILLVRYGAKFPKIEMDDPDKPIEVLPAPGPIFKAGLHFLLPVFVLIWCLMIERLSPGLSAFWGTTLLIFIITTHRPLDAFFRKQQNIISELMAGVQDLKDGLIGGARNMASISIATATAGIIVGAVSQTSIGSVLADVVEVLSFGNLALMLVLVAVLCLILGMGLPTTANYIVVSSLLANVIVELGAQNGLIVPLISVHLFVFYYGLMADVTPPVGLASFAAAAISGGNPIKTGIIAFGYSMRTAILPFIFIYNPDLLLINVGWLEGITIFIVATIAMLAFTAGVQGFMFIRSTIFESIILLLVAFSLFRPDFWIDQVVDRYEQVPASEIMTTLDQIKSDTFIRLWVSGEDDLGDPRRFMAVIKLPQGDDVASRLNETGLQLFQSSQGLEVDVVEIGSAASQAGLDVFQVLEGMEVPNPQPPKQLIYIPAFGLILFVAISQRRRKLKLKRS